MTSRTGNKRSSPSAATKAGFSLIELLLVMALLSIVIAIAVPSLSAFFKGRTIDSEARRFLSLTRYGQSRAVSEGIPMWLWVDADEKTYGLEGEPGWDEQDPKAVEFKLDQALALEVVKTNVAKPRLNNFSDLQLLGKKGDPTRMALPKIKFLPDGSIGVDSPESLRLKDKDGAVLAISRTENRLNYEIRTSQQE